VSRPKRGDWIRGAAETRLDFHSGGLPAKWPQTALSPLPLLQGAAEIDCAELWITRNSLSLAKSASVHNQLAVLGRRCCQFDSRCFALRKNFKLVTCRTAGMAARLGCIRDFGMWCIRIALCGAALVAATASASAQTVRMPTPAPQPASPTMVAAYGAWANGYLGAGGSWLLLCILGGGVIGAAIAWLLVQARTERADPMPTRQQHANQAVRRHPPDAFDHRRDDPGPRPGEREYSNQPSNNDLSSAYENRRYDPASAHAERGRYSRERPEGGAPWRNDRDSSNANDWSHSRETQNLAPRWGRTRTPVHGPDRRPAAFAHDAVSDELGERQKASRPGIRNAGSAYDSFFDALRDGTEADLPSDHNAASPDDPVGDASTPSATPAQSNPLDQLDTTPPVARKRRRRDAGERLYEGLELKMASLLGRATGKDSYREEAERASVRKPTSAYDAVSHALRARQEADQAGERAEADQLGGHNAASAYDAIGDALGESEDAHQPSGHDAPSAYDAVRDALAETPEEGDQPNRHNAASAYDAVRDALGESEEADQPEGHNPAPTVGASLEDREEVDELLAAMRLLPAARR